MATNCSWCGKQIGFTDIARTYEAIGKNTHCICGECSGKISSAKNGYITFEEITTEKTAPELFNYLSKQVEITSEMIQEQQLKEKAQHTNPLYDDIHQIAGDLRFIKNYLVFCILVGIIWGFIYLVSML